ncbi:hypothetical protein [Paenibacillus sp. FSL E2-0178]
MSGPAGQDEWKKMGFKNNGFAVLLQDSKAVSTYIDKNVYASD